MSKAATAILYSLPAIVIAVLIYKGTVSGWILPASPRPRGRTARVLALSRHLPAEDHEGHDEDIPMLWDICTAIGVNEKGEVNNWSHITVCDAAGMSVAIALNLNLKHTYSPSPPLWIKPENKLSWRSLWRCLHASATSQESWAEKTMLFHVRNRRAYDTISDSRSYLVQQACFVTGPL